MARKIAHAPHPTLFLRELRENVAQQKASQYMLMFRSPQAEEILSENNYEGLRSIILRPGLEKGYFTEEDAKAYAEAWAKPGALTGGLNSIERRISGPPHPGRAASNRRLCVFRFHQPLSGSRRL